MNRIFEIDEAGRTAWVGPGVVNLDLSEAVAGRGLQFAPAPLSQSACTLGRTVSTNAGAQHSLP